MKKYHGKKQKWRAMALAVLGGCGILAACGTGQNSGTSVSDTTASEVQAVADDEPPVIEGVEELTIAAGASVSYKKGITVTDNCDANPKLTVDTSGVDTSQVGDYPVTYTAVDAAGNETSVTTTIHVEMPTLETATQEIVDAEADRLLATILTDDMSEYEKAEAIYWWCHDNIAYSDNVERIDPVAGAFQGLAYRKGDCYTYAMTAKCLLTRAGITNMDIEQIPSDSRKHCWNLIDIGEGWHHFDTCGRADGATFFYKTDEELMSYSDAHEGTHTYDRSRYPEIQ